jgi:hypothetical protein
VYSLYDEEREALVDAIKTAGDVGSHRLASHFSGTDHLWSDARLSAVRQDDQR